MNLQEKRNAVFSVPLKTETVEVPEWGFPVVVREMTGEQRGKWMTEVGINKKQHLAETMAVIACVRDAETGEPLFAAADRDTLAGTSGAVISRLSEIALRISGLSKEAEDAAKNESN